MNIQENIRSQYLAALAMLEQAAVKCPDEAWDDPADQNAVWQVLYHALFFTHLYLQPELQAFRPWSKHRSEYERMQKREEPYSRADVLEYLAFCRAQVDQQVAALDLEAPSGFEWLPFDKLGLQFYNIRHLQHHVGELAERLGARCAVSVDWVSKGG